jgi:hypothetical protein
MKLLGYLSDLGGEGGAAVFGRGIDGNLASVSI